MGNRRHRKSQIVHLLVVSVDLDEGGVQRFASTLIRHLDKRQFNITLVLFQDKSRYTVCDDVQVEVLGSCGIASTVRIVRRLAKAIDHYRPDVVLSTMDYVGMFVGEALRHCRVRPVWVARTSNNPDHITRGWRGKLRKLWLRRVYPYADLFVANSHALAAYFPKVFSCASGRMRVILNPVDVRHVRQLAEQDSQYAIDIGVPNLVYIARLRRHKRPDVLLDAFHLVLEQRPAKLWICGDGPHRGWIERRIKQLRLNKHVQLVGYVDNVFPLMKRASVVVATSDFEGMPNSLLEAQVLGIPIVSTRSAFGPEEIIEHAKSGLLVNCGDSRAVAAAILQCLNDDHFSATVAATAKRRAEDRFDLDATLPPWIDLLEECLGCT